MIAHRLSTLEHCDKVLMIDRGRAELRETTAVTYIPMSGEDINVRASS
jgi:ABC-type bacteriocin/lantibiotic exporter with double-glycine peptidase domain